MKIDNAIFPYPVLNPQNDDINFGICQFTPLTTQDAVSKDFNIKFLIEIDDKYIINLIQNGYAKYMMEINCAGTHLTKRVASTSNLLSCIIKNGEVKGNVEITLTITATKKIEEYQNPNAHEAFGNNKFTIEPGEILAYFSTEILKADIRYSKLGSASSFIEIRELNKETNYMEVDLESTIIGICLPKNMYDLYKVISQNTQYLETIHASMVNNALQYALMRFDEYKDRDLTWVKTIQYYLENLDVLKEMNTEYEEDKTLFSDPENCLKVAQIILDNPIERLLNNLNDEQKIMTEINTDED